MKNTLKITLITLTAIALALIATIALATAYNPYHPMTPINTNIGNFFGNMMGQYTSQNQNTQTNTGQYLGGYGCRGYGNGYTGPSYTTNTTSTLTIQQATQNAEQYVANLNNPDLKVTQVEEYQNNFYVQVTEKSTGNGAFELLVDKYTGNIAPEMGPNMMWNTKYTVTAGMMGVFNGIRGMMGLQRTANSPMAVTVEQAKTDATQYLNSHISGTTVGDVTQFSGYYTVEVLQNGTPYGMLSVNGYTGQVWYHNWHGTFVQEVDVS